MSWRKVCYRKGHKFAPSGAMMMLPYVYCRRWFCSASAVAAWAPPNIAPYLHNAIPDENRVPPEKIEIEETS